MLACFYVCLHCLLCKSVLRYDKVHTMLRRNRRQLSCHQLKLLSHGIPAENDDDNRYSKHYKHCLMDYQDELVWVF